MVSEEDLNRIVISLSGVFFNMLIHKNERVGTGVIFWLVFFSKNTLQEAPAEASLVGPVWNMPLVRKDKACDSFPGCRLLKSFCLV